MIFIEKLMRLSMESIFPTINHIDDLRPRVADKEEIRFTLQPNGTIVGCYMVSMTSTFDNMWAKECRGIVFDSAGLVIARPLSKFHNVGEKEATRVENLDWTKVARVMDKRDGSMIHTVVTKDGFALKSKKSFTSDVAIAATKWVTARPNYVSFCDDITDVGYTAIFEYTAPTARIVLYYPEEMMTLLHIRDNATGEYLSPKELERWAVGYGIPVVQEVNDFWWTMSDAGVPTTREFNFEALMAAVHTREGVEGWIVQFESGEMVKVKTKWYMDRHRVMTFIRERDIARLAVHEGLDDVKAMLVDEGADITEIEAIERRVVADLNTLQASIDEGVASVKGLSFKDAALKLQAGTAHPNFSLIMATLRGKEPDLKQYFLNRMLDVGYTLRQLNIMQTIGEPE